MPLKTDSTKVLVDKEEFKYIIQVNIEKTFLDSLLEVKNFLIDIQDRMLADKDAIIGSMSKDNNLLKKDIENNITPWYNRWLPGWASGVIMALAAVLLIH